MAFPKLLTNLKGTKNALHAKCSADTVVLHVIDGTYTTVEIRERINEKPFRSNTLFMT